MATWLIDPAHSEVHFKIRHLVISTITGSFKKFEGSVESEKDDFSDAKIQFSAEVASVETNNDQRDGHLKSGDFFDAEKYPKISFVSTGVEKKSGDEYILKGNLTMRDVTNPVELKVEYGGTTQDSYGQTKAGFEITGKVNRQEYGLTWSGVTEAGGIIVSDDVKLVMSIQIVKQQA
ncbi:MAG: YceI family protein [Ginsengibacter sp.]